jgi:hypothetical protein
MVIMFIEGFEKIAVLAATLTPEQYYDLVREKDPYVGALLGAATGAAVGAAKGKPGRRAASALVGAGLGAATGGAVGHAGGKVLRRYQAHRVRRLAGGLGLRATPMKPHESPEE